MYSYSDGKTLAIGAPGLWSRADRPGYVKNFQWDDSRVDWKQLGQTLEGDELGDQYGQSVSLSHDGTTVAIGASSNDKNGKNSGNVKV